MLNMKRMGIFIFYDKYGIVDQYLDTLLDSMNIILQKMIIIINGKIRGEEYYKLEKYSRNIFIRENQGFDAGGYKDAFTRFITFEELMRYDEIVLFNDTFYGPLYPWIDVFNVMEKEKTDFWGLSRHPGGIQQSGIIGQHIQSFFLVCRKSLVSSANWIEFWNCLKYPKNIMEAISNFEVGFSEYFIRNGFGGKAYTDLQGIFFEYNSNPYLDYADDLIKFAKFPIIKKRVFSLKYFLCAERSLEYIENYTNYNVNLIYSNLRRLCKERTINIPAPFDYDKLEDFYSKHKNIYIYGHGCYGQAMAMYFRYKGWQYRGFLVTEKDKIEDNVFGYSEVNFKEEDGVILALGKKALEEVLMIIRKRFNMSQMLLPESD